MNWLNSSTMLTIVSVWIVGSFVLAIGLLIDQLRRPLTAWEAAGRDRRFWVALTLVLGFHGLGEYAAAGYLIGVLPRFRGQRGESRLGLQRRSAAIAGRWWRSTPEVRTGRRFTALEELALVAAVLVFASCFVHSLVIAVHFEEHWLLGSIFLVAACLQAIWVARVVAQPLNPRLLVAGLVGNAALALAWGLSRLVAVPIGSRPWHPEAVGVTDLLATLDEVVAVVLLTVVLAGLRREWSPVGRSHLRVATMVTGPLFIFSLLAAVGIGHTHG